MLVMIAVGLYTSRITLKILGIEDYGLYNVVGGVVAMFAFLNNAMVAASQRFISFELGKEDFARLKKVFSTSVSTHFCIAIIILLITETAGLWFVNTKLNIPVDRIDAANWIYQCSILAFMIRVLSVPYNSCIVAHEHMKTFAYVSIIDAVLNLTIVYLLLIWNIDKLKLYATLIFLIAIVIQIIYMLYCKRNFVECKYRFSFDRDLFKRMFSFAGWSFIGNLSHSFKDQGANIILNIFFGTFINAARGIAAQVNGAINSLTSSFQMAINPQITKSYATGDYEHTKSLISKGSRYSFYLLAVISIPAFINIDYILSLWLTVIPEYTAVFIRLILLVSLVNSMANPIITTIQATGNVRNFNIIVGGIILLDLPISYFVLKMGYLPYSVMYVSLFTTTVSLFARLFLMKRVIKYSTRYFFFSIFLKNMLLAGATLLILLYIQSLFAVNFTTFILMSFFSALFLSGVIYLLGMETNERKLVREKMLSIMKYK
jgi:O-antigen/teichoic acid export membrane protein